jgi:DNA modification methylase
MAVKDQILTDKYALYNGDCVEVFSKLPDESLHMTIYSPPFCGLYNYSSDEKDMSNCRTYAEFFQHYNFIFDQIHRVTMPGRMTAVHCMDVPGKNGSIVDFPGDIIRMHTRCRDPKCTAPEIERANGQCGHGWFKLHARFGIWKEPLRVAIRTRSKGLTHRQLCKDSVESNNAGADYLLVFRKSGENKIPIAHPDGLKTYAGEREIPESFKGSDGVIRSRLAYENWDDPQTNKLAHWIWQQYASSYWDDIRIGRVLPYQAARDPEDEKHCHPLQLDVIERAITLWSNPGEKIGTPYLGVGSEAYGAVQLGRKAIGAELKPSYFRQAGKNVASAEEELAQDAFDFAKDEDTERLDMI